MWQSKHIYTIDWNKFPCFSAFIRHLERRSPVSNLELCPACHPFASLRAGSERELWIWASVESDPKLALRMTCIISKCLRLLCGLALLPPFFRYAILGPEEREGSFFYGTRHLTYAESIHRGGAYLPAAIRTCAG